MRQVLAAMVVTYQRLAPNKIRGRCIFGESCSNFVLRRLREDGAGAGLRAFRERFEQCRPGYFLLPRGALDEAMETPVRLADGSVVEVATLSRRVREQLSCLAGQTDTIAR